MTGCRPLPREEGFGFLVFFFWPHHAACRILVPQPGIEPTPLAVEVRSLNHWTAREVPGFCFFKTGQGFLTPSSFYPGNLCVLLVLSSKCFPQSPFPIPSHNALVQALISHLVCCHLLTSDTFCALFDPQFHLYNAGHFPAHRCCEPHHEPPEPFPCTRGSCTHQQSQLRVTAPEA